MSYPIYYVEANDTLPILFDTFDGGTGASITMTGLAVTDIEIYKDGSVTQRASDAGYTLLDTDGIDFDGVTGIHGFSLDLSDNTDAGFYAVGSWYHVVVSSITVDGQTVNFVAAAFRIVSATRGMAGTALPDAAADAAGGLPISDGGGLDLDAILVDTNSLNDTKIPDTISLANINAEADTALSDFFTSAAQLVDDIWDEVLTGATHNVANSAGRRLRQLDLSLPSDTAQAGGSDTITLAAGESATDGFYVGTSIVIQDGTGSGQARYIIGYDGTTKVATVARPWTTNPSSDSVYVISADNQIDFLQMGLASAGGATSITLDANASATDDIYNGQFVRIFGGTGKYQVRAITDYNGTTKVATISPAWTTNPDSTSYYCVLGLTRSIVNEVEQLGTQAKADVNAECDTAISDAALATAAALATVDSNVDAILLDTAEIGAAGAGLTEAGGTGDHLTALALSTAGNQAVADLIIPKKNTALSNIEFLMVDSADSVTPKTGLSITGTRSIDGGAFSAVSGTIAEVSNGIYQFDALAADMNGTIITFRFAATGADDKFITIRTSG